MNVRDFCTSNTPLFTAGAGTVVGDSGRACSVLDY